MNTRVRFQTKKDKKAFDRWTHEHYPQVYSYRIPIGVSFYSILGDIIVKTTTWEGWALADQILDEASTALGIKLVLEEI